MAESRDDVAGLTHVCTEEALIAYRAGRLEQVMDAAERGEALAQQCDEVRLVARCREVRGRSCTDRAQFESATPRNPPNCCSSNFRSVRGSPNTTSEIGLGNFG